MGSVRNQRLIQKFRTSPNEKLVELTNVLIRMLPIRKPLKTKKSSTPSNASGNMPSKKTPMALPKGCVFANGANNGEECDNTTVSIAIALIKSSPITLSFLMVRNFG